MRHLSEKARKLLRLADAQGIRCCLLRESHFQESSEPEEIDIVVARREVEQLFDVWWSTGFLTDVRCSPTHIHFHFSDREDSESVLIIDVMVEMYYGDSGHLIRVKHEKILIENCQRDERGIWRPRQSDALLHGILHALLDKREPRLKALSALTAEYKKVSKLDRQNFHRDAEQFVGETGTQKLIQAIRKNKRSVWKQLRWHFFARLAFRDSSVGTLRRYFSNQIRKRTRMQRWPLARTMTVALLGPDGVGKSTIAKQLQDDLNARHVYMGGRGSHLPTTRVIKKYHESRKAGSETRERKMPPGSDQVSSVSVDHKIDQVSSRAEKLKDLTTRPAIRIHAYFEYLARYLAALSPVGHSLVVFDRYVYDKVVRSEEVEPDAWDKPYLTLLRWCYRHAFPSPDILIVLDAPSELLAERKQEHTIEILEDLRSGYLRFASVEEGNSATTITVIGTDGELRDTVRAIKRVIFLAKLRHGSGRIWI